MSTHPGGAETIRSDEGRGLACRWRGAKRFRVVYTRPAWGGRFTRRGACRNRGKRVTTWERSGG